jgi:hypothetical protein
MSDRQGADAALTDPRGLPRELVADVERAGYYPTLVNDALEVAIAGEEVRCFLVHQETTFDRVEVRRHVTVLALTPTRLVVAHADDHDPDALSPEPYASASTEAVPIDRVSSVVPLARRHPPERPPGRLHPARAQPHDRWGSLTRVDLEPATCADPDCEADHGYTGTLAADDITVRLSPRPRGEDAVRAAVEFPACLSAATAAIATTTTTT